MRVLRRWSASTWLHLWNRQGPVWARTWATLVKRVLLVLEWQGDQLAAHCRSWCRNGPLSVLLSQLVAGNITWQELLWASVFEGRIQRQGGRVLIGAFVWERRAWRVWICPFIEFCRVLVGRGTPEWGGMFGRGLAWCRIEWGFGRARAYPHNYGFWMFFGVTSQCPSKISAAVSWLS